MCVNGVHIRARECAHDNDGKSFDDLTAAVSGHVVREPHWTHIRQASFSRHFLLAIFFFSGDFSFSVIGLRVIGATKFFKIDSLYFLGVRYQTAHTIRQIPTGTSNYRCLCQRVRFGG